MRIAMGRLFKVGCTLLIAMAIISPFFTARVAKAVEARTPQVIVGGVNDALSNAATEYNQVMGGGSWTTDVTLIDEIIPTYGTFSDLYFRLSAAPGAGTSYTFTLMVNGSASTLTTTISDAATTANDTAHAVAVAPGDNVSLRSTYTGAPGTPWASWSLVFKADVPGESIVLANLSSSSGSAQYDGLSGKTGVFATYAARALPIPTDGTFKHLYLEMSSDPGTAPDAYTVALTVNGADTDLTTTVVADNVTGQDLTNEVVVTAGDTAAYHVTPVSSPSATPRIAIGVVFISTTLGESIIFSAHAAAATNSAVRYNHFSAFNPAGWQAVESDTYSLVQATTLRKFYVVTEAAPGVGKSYQLDVRVNGGDSGLTATVAGAATSASDTTHSATPSDGQTIDIECTPAGTPTSVRIKWAVVSYIAPNPFIAVDVYGITSSSATLVGTITGGPPTGFTANMTLTDMPSHQGVTSDGTYLYATDGGLDSTPEQSTITKLTKAGVQVAQRSGCYLDGTDMAQINSITYKDGYLYVGSNNFDIVPMVGYTKVYRASDLAYITEYPMQEAYWHEGVTWHNGYWWATMAGGDGALQVGQYTANFTFIADYPLSYTQTGALQHGYQHGIFIGDYLFTTIHDALIPNKVDVYYWNGSQFLEVARLDPPTADCTQGLGQEPGQDFIWWAARNDALGIDSIVYSTIEYAGITINARGFVWDTSTQADPGNTDPSASSYGDYWTEATASTGTFTHLITGLVPRTTYYTRATANTTAFWVYSDEINFTTLAGIPNTSNNWTWMQNNVMSYADNVTISVSGTQVLRYQPDSIIQGTTLPDESGNGNDGIFTWGGLPAGVGVVLSAFVGNAPARAPPYAVEGTEPDWVATGNMTGGFGTSVSPKGPFAQIIIDAATAGTTPSQLPFIILTLLVILAISFLVSHTWRRAAANSPLWAKGVLCIGMIGIAVALQYWDWWMLFFYVIFFAALGLASRHQSFHT